MKASSIALAAAALIAGVSIAGAQNAPTTSPSTSPNSINKGDLPTKNSGSESMKTAQPHHARHHSRHHARRARTKKTPAPKPSES
jgi:hypothetical protein